eukprot:GDKI01008419.1.p1 GENE.GDKI01008419.1~~GDKI01008419.1.p1  ORF type:complete len:172 (-),score=29.29 GDKI01008419.1:307-822(-)
MNDPHFLGVSASPEPFSDDFVPTGAALPREPIVFHEPEALPEGMSDTEVDVFESLRRIRDPEFPYSLGQLRVVFPSGVAVYESSNHSRIEIVFRPTVPHCSMATLIGLCIRTKLAQEYENRFKIDILLAEGSHKDAVAVQKQINDKERVAAALENPTLAKLVAEAIAEAEA